MYQPCQTIAEIGCNHKGDINTAKELILLAKDCGADVAKFQKRNSKELLPEEQYNNPHPNPINSYGETYGQHREFLEFSKDQHKELTRDCWQVSKLKLFKNKSITLETMNLTVDEIKNNIEIVEYYSK